MLFFFSFFFPFWNHLCLGKKLEKIKKILEKKKQKLWQKEEKDVEIIRVC
jgi:hypothetical protein